MDEYVDAHQWMKKWLDVMWNIGGDEVRNMTWEEVESAWMDCALLTVLGVDYHTGTVTMGVGNG